VTIYAPDGEMAREHALHLVGKHDRLMSGDVLIVRTQMTTAQ
jgi:hypothetical protein